MYRKVGRSRHQSGPSTKRMPEKVPRQAEEHAASFAGLALISRLISSSPAETSGAGPRMRFDREILAGEAPCRNRRLAVHQDRQQTRKSGTTAITAKQENAFRRGDRRIKATRPLAA
jgi:hypothetical protein